MKTRYLAFLFVLLLSCSKEMVMWPEPTQTSKPWTRWWWMGNAVDHDNLQRELKEMHSAGIGGVEITPIYGVKGEEHRFIEYLSPQFTEVLNFTIEKANQLGMGVDLPPGSGWRCGGPFVPEEKGLWSLRIQKQELKKGEQWQAPKNGGTLAAASFLNMAGNATVVNVEATFEAPENGAVYMAFRIKNRDMVKRAADGGQGWAIDTFNEDITNWYLDEFWKRLGIDEGKLRCFFHDSFEYTGDFTTHFTEEFRKRRGYDLAQYLYVLAGDCNDPEIVARVKSDYRETLSDLVLESFIQPMTGWANRHQSLNRNQAHGSPGNILDLYAACDIPETEIFRTVEPGTVDVFVNKFASSAAHVTGRRLVSSESFTWLKEHWTVTTSDMLRATNRFFLAGINHMFFHGTCYSPADAEWPGWLFYASTQVNNRNPLWPELPALFKYIELSQSVMQKAQPETDLLVYWPYYDVAAGEGRLFNHLGVNKDAGWFKSHPISALSEDLTAAGYSLDYISDKQLLNCKTENGRVITEGNAGYMAVVVPKTAYIPLETMKKLKDLMAGGAKVYFDEQLPESVPGMFNLEERKSQLSEIKAAIGDKNTGDPVELLKNSNIEGESSLAAEGFHYLKMKLDGETCYMICNTGLEQKDAWVELQSKGKSAVVMNPLNGEIVKAEKRGRKVRIQLEPEQLVFLVITKKVATAPGFIYENGETEIIPVEGRWTVQFIKGGPVLPEQLELKKPVFWTNSGVEGAERFAGTARYSVNFNLKNNINEAVLDLGNVKDCAHVYLNGKDYGTLLGPAFKVKVENLPAGENRLEVEVTNVAANRIRDLDIRGVEWRKFYDINFVNIDYEPFDASGWEIMDAGLQGPVTLKALR